MPIVKNLNDFIPLKYVFLVAICIAPDPPAHGSVTPETIAHCTTDNCVPGVSDPDNNVCCPELTTLRFVCDDNYSLVGYASTYCTVFKIWSYSIGTCVHNPPSKCICTF